MTVILSLAFADGARAEFIHQICDNLLQDNVRGNGIATILRADGVGQRIWEVFSSFTPAVLGLTEDQAAAFASGGINIDHLEYDWNLNDVK